MPGANGRTQPGRGRLGYHLRVAGNVLVKAGHVAS
jgi:hypothetical protein